MARGPIARMRLVGARELEANLRELPVHLRKGAVTRSLRKVAEPIAEDAARRAETSRASGRNISKITVSTTLSRRQRRKSRRPGANERIVYIGVRPSPIAHLIEFGTGPRFNRRGAYRGRMPALPFMRPAWDAGKMEALDKFGQMLGAEIERTAARLARRNARRAAR